MPDKRLEESPFRAIAIRKNAETPVLNIPPMSFKTSKCFSAAEAVQ
jgi:hypothetical protein